MIYAIDANIVSFILQERVSSISRLREAILHGSDIIIPPITYYEIIRGFRYKSAPKKEDSFIQMCKLYSIGEMTFSAWDRAASIYTNARKSGNTIGDADILIAAFCIVNSYTLVTNNTKHFEFISELVIEDWSE